VVALDVGSAQIKIVEMRRGNPVRLVRYQVFPTPRGALESGTVRRPHDLHQALQDAWEARGFPHRRVVTALTGQTLLFRHVEFPRMPRHEVRHAVRWQFEQFFQLPYEEALSDHWVLPNPKGRNLLQVALVAVPKEPVLQFLDHLQDAGISPVGLDIEALAVFRSIALSRPEAAAGTTVILDVGAASTNISIFHQGVLQAIRLLPVGGNHFTRSIMAGMRIDYYQAEAIKLRVGLDLEDREVSGYLIPVRERLFAEVSRTLNFHLTEHRNERLDFVAVVGGGAMLRGLPIQLRQFLIEAIDRRIGKEFRVEVGNPLAHVRGVKLEDQADAFGPLLAVAVGLALGRIR
jgi:type IV pilus assembly protein PilM